VGTGFKRIEYGSAGTYDEAVVLPLAGLKTMDDVENYPWPNPDDFDYSGIAQQCERVQDFAICLGGAGDPDIVNGVCLGEDTGNQNGRMVSPKDFDEVFRPRLKRFYDLAHEFGAKAMMHSCGDTHDIMPTFIEMGLDIKLI